MHRSLLSLRQLLLVVHTDLAEMDRGICKRDLGLFLCIRYSTGPGRNIHTPWLIIDSFRIAEQSIF